MLSSFGAAALALATIFAWPFIHAQLMEVAHVPG